MIFFIKMSQIEYYEKKKLKTEKFIWIVDMISTKIVFINNILTIILLQFNVISEEMQNLIENFSN